MHLIILPGDSKKFNEQWLYDSAKHFADLFDSVTTHPYEHWKTENPEERGTDISLEAEKLKAEAKKLKGDYIVYAKSAGTVVTVKAVGEKMINPKKCIFVGSPWGAYAEGEGSFKNWIANFNVPTLLIQQTNDMFFKFNELEKVLKEFFPAEYELVEIAGENHAYNNFDFIKEKIRNFIL